ncbi:hypothetical protein HPB48_018308 [Haemaphysalis longicornis]|uniref:rhomboid protease n=1 Tax=Haemaphysalis longicornis TaxID=44386 RepID=A0A9J6FPW4_HAELO|nr:hypothetical protein HPB48_018308 [Haemaphysalis longicornis]
MRELSELAGWSRFAPARSALAVCPRERVVAFAGLTHWSLSLSCCALWLSHGSSRFDRTEPPRRWLWHAGPVFAVVRSRGKRRGGPSMRVGFERCCSRFKAAPYLNLNSRPALSATDVCSNKMSGKRTRSFKIAVHRRDERDIWQPRAGGNCCQRHGTLSAATTPGRGYGCGSLSSAAADECEEGSSGASPWRRPGGGGVSLFGSMVRAIATEFLPDGRDRKYYADHYTCRPPPLFVFVVTLIEDFQGEGLKFDVSFSLFSFSSFITRSGVLVFFIYRPDKRLQVWRFVFYMVLHAGWIHLLFNLLVQMLVGLPLEMVHGSLRIGTVYMAGVLAGSLGTSVFDTDVYLVGASGGVYALLAAHLANVLLNYNQMQFGLVRLVGVFVIASADVGFAVYDRYAAEPHGPPVSYVAHLTGALAGLTIGLLVLKNFEQKTARTVAVVGGTGRVCGVHSLRRPLQHLQLLSPLPNSSDQPVIRLGLRPHCGNARC